MTDPEVARMIVEGLAYQLAALPASVWVDAERGGCAVAIVSGLRSAREAFNRHVTENDVVMLSDQIDADVLEGLSALDAQKS